MAVRERRTIMITAQQLDEPSSLAPLAVRLSPGIRLFEILTHEGKKPGS
jgi:hypothetical protein